MIDREAAPAESQPIAAPLVLVFIAAAHLAYVLWVDLRGLPVLLPAFASSLVLGVGYAVSAWLCRRERGFPLAVNLIIGEDLGVLAVGLILGYPWADYLRPGSVAIIALQLAFAFAEIWRRQEAGRPIVPATRLAWFVLLYMLVFAGYAIFEPQGLWNLGTAEGL
ncbi:MAG: hypothetical protein JSU87_13825 [Gemmatimonadota bacterium]|nr:MAG: hypothetical protein JSU87_13825 [Gemmatimonadota bacterium]